MTERKPSGRRCFRCDAILYFNEVYPSVIIDSDGSGMLGRQIIFCSNKCLDCHMSYRSHSYKKIGDVRL
jgi:hypothetical protein